MGKKTATPAAPNYTALAEQTAAQNRPTQNTAMGSTTWSKDASGNPVQTQTLNPAEQARLDQQRGIYGGLLDQAGKSMSSPIDTSGMQGYNPNKLDPGFGAVQQVKDDYLNLMQPQMKQQRSNMEAMLKQRGIPMNSAAYANALRTMNDSDARRGWEATDKATSAYNDIFQRGLAGNEQANQTRGLQLQEAQGLRELPMNELKQFGGLVGGNLEMPSFMQGADYLNAGGMQYKTALDAANAKKASGAGLGSTLGTIGGGLLGSMIGMPMLGANLGGSLGGQIGGR